MTLTEILASRFTGVRLMGRRILKAENELGELVGCAAAQAVSEIDAIYDYVDDMQARLEAEAAR